jgi:hypothetical protein
MRARLVAVEANARCRLARSGLKPGEGQATLVFHPLGRAGEPGSRADRTCDRCGSYVPLGTDLAVFIFQPKPWLMVPGGMCCPCWDAEVGSDD